MGTTHEVTLPNGDVFEVDYTRDISVDRNTLDVDWEDHPLRSFAYSIALAEAKKKLDELKRENRLLLAEIIMDVKKNPELYDLTAKPNMDQVKAAAEADEECEKSYLEIINQQHEVNILQGAMKALDDKKDALENLVKLHGQTYFATPQTDMEGVQRLSQLKQKRVSETVKAAKKKHRIQE